MKKDMKKVDFELLMDLAAEAGDDRPFETVISVCAMADIPMSDAVIKLGVVFDILLPDYRNGWSLEEDED